MDQPFTTRANVGSFHSISFWACAGASAMAFFTDGSTLATSKLFPASKPIRFRRAMIGSSVTCGGFTPALVRWRRRPQTQKNPATEKLRFVSRHIPFTDDASKSDVARRRIDGLRMTRGGAISAAITWRAQMRAAFQHFARNFDVGLTRIVAVGFGSTAGIFRYATRFWRIGLMLRRVPVAGPLPYVADHVVEAVTVRRKCSHRRRPFVTAGTVFLMRKFTLPRVRHLAIVRHELTAPGKFRVLDPAARGKFPFG